MGRNRRTTVRGIRLVAVLTAVAAMLLTGASADAAPETTSQAAPEVGGQEVAPTLLNGWTAAPFGTRTVKAKIANGVVRLRGAVASGSSAIIFNLPANMRPGTTVHVAVDLCSAAGGRLTISPNGDVLVDAEGPFSDAQCFTSLDGAWFLAAPPGQVALTLVNGWTPAPFGTRAPKAVLIGGVVYFKGALTNGTVSTMFTMPVGMRPAANVYVPISLCNAAEGRIRIRPSGKVTVQAEGDFFDAQCFTSLEGASYTLTPPANVNMALLNGWSNSPFNTRPIKASLDGGVVRFRGAMDTAGSDAHAFTLPVGLRPAADVYLQIDLCAAANGRLYIPTNGEVQVIPEVDFTDAQCFTSLDGASYVRG